MCHLMLVMPVLALPVLWLLPLEEGVTVYAVVFLVSGAVYWLAVKAMRSPIMNGTETLLRSRGQVRAADGRRGSIWVASDLWSAESSDFPLAVGDSVEVVGFEGLRLIVRKVDAADTTRGLSRHSHS